MNWIDYWYLILVVPALLVALFAQVKVQSTFKKYSQIGTRSGLSGAEASMNIQRQNGIRVPLEQVKGSMTDHYDPRANVIRLSETVYGVRSIAAIGVAAHETGHALQYENGYGPIKIRSAILPATQFATTGSPYMILIGLLTAFEWLAIAGVAFFGLSVVFQLLTLPVEFNASSRALKALGDGGLLTSEELEGAKHVLSAAAMTYVAALFVSLMSLIRLIILLGGRGRRDR